MNRTRDGEFLRGAIKPIHPEASCPEVSTAYGKMAYARSNFFGCAWMVFQCRHQNHSVTIGNTITKTVLIKHLP